jgi:hypothetical protein
MSGVQLSDAFALLLGRPLAEFDSTATYALFHWDDELSDTYFEEVEPLVEVAPAPAAAADTGETDLSPERWRFDHGRSVFLVEDWEHPITDHLSGPAVTGVELDRAATAAGVDLSELEDEYVTVLHRVVTDGSLYDAMLAATWTMSAPDGLVRPSRRAEVEPSWREAFEPITDAALREHLWAQCLTPQWARSEGAWFARRDCGEELRALVEVYGYQVLAAWHFGEAQAASAVVRL